MSGLIAQLPWEQWWKKAHKYFSNSVAISFQLIVYSSNLAWLAACRSSVWSHSPPKGLVIQMFSLCAVFLLTSCPTQRQVKQRPHFPGKSMGAFYNWSDMMPKNPNKTGQVSQAWGEAGQVNILLIPRGWILGTALRSCAPQMVPGHYLGESELMQTKSVQRHLPTQKLWNGHRPGQRPWTGHSCPPVTCPCWPHAARSVHDLLEVRKAKAPHFLYLKGSKGSSEGILRHFMTPWRSWSRMPLHEAALANLPFVSGNLFPVCPMGKTSMFPSHRGCWSFTSKNTRCPGTVGVGTMWAPNLRWKHKVRHFQTEIIQVIFVISNFKAPLFCLLEKWKNILLVQYRSMPAAGKILACWIN